LAGLIAVHELLAVQHRQHRQQLTQQQQHLTGAKHQLTLGAGLEQLPVGAASLPFPHQPEPLGGGDRGPQPGHLGMEHALELPPELASPGPIDLGTEQPQGHRGLSRQLVAGPPEIALGPLTQDLFEPVALADHLTLLCGHQPTPARARSGWCSPLPASQSAS
jgi:hypothetical protein